MDEPLSYLSRPLDDTYERQFKSDVCALTSSEGNFDLLKKYITENEFIPDCRTYAFAACRGDIQTLNWLFERFGNICLRARIENQIFYERLIWKYALLSRESNRAAVLRWLRERHFRWDDSVIETAITYD